ncbi:MAG: alpha/beta fold hydrolase [Alphaproteobacteria bacterium]
MKLCLAFVHGWGLDASFFDPLREYLPEVYSVTFDLGFHGQPSSPPLPDNVPVIAVGHSTGFLWLLHHRPSRWKALVAVNGFSRFIEAADYRPAVAAKVLDRMIFRFTAAPRAVAAEFLGRCGLPTGPEFTETLDREACAAGLEWLRGWDERETLARDPSPLLALAGRNDPIVTPAMTEQCFDGRPGTRLCWHQGGGHLLPVTDPAWCARHLRDFLADLSLDPE